MESFSQFDEISELDINYVDTDAAAITSDVPKLNNVVSDIHCIKQEDNDDSDTDTTTAESIPLKMCPELNEWVDHLGQFVEATESADEEIFKAITVVRQFVENHRPKLKLLTLKDFFSIN
ncbi:hypothetical protein T02_2826 [Trichinella nativa]|uniref:Uncharacterized protein n=1 Tax=Trichinella nativa TaxID=6335 RepID=A0A0V1LQJ4_9BILA|nr:hypothetical protein T06_8557 [Trichinella sp. T6]KRX76714.1 hypothetical protein T06_13418 [Trichinella sp. T6]KRZ61745.1 hypothetical protein T02_2826 [Trichinella nativa]KRZ85518.1 hypothetical protein T08_5679 [Trichinella sp. T8]